ncbi:MAG: FAD binding domain-containing protein [Azospirillaceae bacterium]
MKPPPLDYRRAGTVEEAVALLAEHGDDARLIAGGQSLMPLLAMRLAAPELLVDIDRIDGLDSVAESDGRVTLGPLIRHCRMVGDPAIARAAPLFARAGPLVAHPGIRNRGTLGGALALGDPAAEFPACALAAGAVMHLASSGGRRSVPAEAFFHGPMETAIAPEEMLVAVELPAPRPEDRFAVREVARRHGDYALAGVAARARVAGGRLSDLRLAFFGVADRPVPAPAAAAILVAAPGDPEALRAAGEALAEEIDFAGGAQASAALRRHLARVVLARAVADLLDAGPGEAAGRAA